MCLFIFKVVDDRPYNGPRRFAITGGLFVEDESIFKVSFKEWNEHYLLPKVLFGKEYYLFIYPSQAAKTTRIFEFMNQIRGVTFERKKGSLRNTLNELEEKKEITSDEYKTGIELLPLYIDMSRMKKARGTTLNELEQSLWHHFIEAMNDNQGLCKWIDPIKYSNFSTLFHNSSLKELFEGKYPILFLDEIDALQSLDEKSDEIITVMNLPNTITNIQRVRNSFLIDLRSIKHSPHSYCLQFVLGISNYMGEFTHTVKGSLFNNLLYGSYFTREQFEELVLQYEQQEKIKIDNEILNDIYERTIGHPGQTIILLRAYHNMRSNSVAECNVDDDLLNLQNWLQEISGDEFLRVFGHIANFKRIKSTIDRDVALQPELLRWILNRNISLDEKVVSTLQQGQIIKEIPFLSNFHLDFVTPLVRKYICILLQRKAKVTMNQIPYLENSKVDFVQIIEATIRQMNQWAVIVGDNDSAAMVDSNVKQDFESAFFTCLEVVVRGASIRQQSTTKFENSADMKKSNPFIKFAKGEQIIVEHCANVDMNLDSVDPNSLLAHVRKTQRYYSEHLSENAYVIHWINISNKNSSYPYWFTHTNAPNVTIIYIFYDPLFFRFEIYHDIGKMIVVEHEKTKLLNIHPKIVYVRIGQDDDSLKPIALYNNTVTELKRAILDQCSKEIGANNFRVRVVKDLLLLPLNIDAAVNILTEGSILQIDLTEQ